MKPGGTVGFFRGGDMVAEREGERGLVGREGMAYICAGRGRCISLIMQRG